MGNPARKTVQAQSLRRKMTPAERRLWSRLRAGRVHGLKFQIQEPIGPYIVDFYCSVARLIIELDGDAHSFAIRNDRVRQAYLEEMGMSVIRFLNYDVFHSLDSVLEVIFESCKGHLPELGRD